MIESFGDGHSSTRLGGAFYRVEVHRPSRGARVIEHKDHDDALMEAAFALGGRASAWRDEGDALRLEGAAADGERIVVVVSYYRREPPPGGGWGELAEEALGPPPSR